MGGLAVPLLATAGAGLVAYTMGQRQTKANDASAANLMSLSNQQNQQALDTLPDAPTDIDTGNNEAAEAARQEQLRQMSSNEASVNPTGGLGDTSTVGTKKKTLGGA